MNTLVNFLFIFYCFLWFLKNVALKNCSSVTHKYFLTKCFESFKLLNPFLKNGTMQESNENTTGFFENSSKFSPKESAEDNSINKKGLQIVVK